MQRRGAALRRGLAAALCLVVCGCSRFGTGKFYEDQLGYSRALGEGEKSATLLNVVRLRYGDSPTFLEPTQVISGYQLQRSVTGGFEAFPAANPSTFLSGGAAAQIQESPTFTFQPLSGEQFAQSFVRPLASSDLLPLAMSGLPIDVLFRLGVQSVNQYSNAVALSETGAAGSPEFFRLIYDLRRLQVAGLLNIRLSSMHMTDGVEGPPPPANRPDAATPTPPPAAPAPPNVPPQRSNGLHAVSGLPPYVYLSFTATTDPTLADIAKEAKGYLHVPSYASEAEIVYGRTPGEGQVGIITRSVLGVMSQLAIEMNVPPEDIVKHRTLPTVGTVGPERRAVVIIHCGRAVPPKTFASVRYTDDRFFWIDDEDFDSKLAFTVLRVLLELARSSNSPGAIVSIPGH